MADKNIITRANIASSVPRGQIRPFATEPQELDLQVLFVRTEQGALAFGVNLDTGETLELKEGHWRFDRSYWQQFANGFHLFACILNPGGGLDLQCDDENGNASTVQYGRDVRNKLPTPDGGEYPVTLRASGTPLATVTLEFIPTGGFKSAPERLRPTNTAPIPRPGNPLDPKLLSAAGSDYEKLRDWSRLDDAAGLFKRVAEQFGDLRLERPGEL